MLRSRRFSRKPYPIPDQNGESLYTFLVQNSAKTVPFATMIFSSCTLFCFRFCFISIYSFNTFSRANKTVSSTQSTLHALANRLIFYTSPASFVGLKTASI